MSGFTNGNDSFAGSGNDLSLNGLAGDDTIIGSGGRDTIIGGDGNDSISGVGGQDFLLWSAGQGNDTIDGGVAPDQIQIDTPGFTSFSTDGLTAPPGWEFVPSPGYASGTDYTSAAGATWRYILTGETLFIRNVESSVSCFCAGTMIAIPGGECAVETLKIGDLVLTTKGEAKPVRWLGRQTVSTRFGDPLRILPVRILADALEDGVPSRDLLLSPDHAVLAKGILVQAGALVNGITILRQFDVPEVFTYHHIELAEHDLVLAEGAPAETFVDNIDRLAFDNWAEHQALYGDEPSIPEMDRPRAKAQRQVPRFVLLALEARAGLRKTA